MPIGATEHNSPISCIWALQGTDIDGHCKKISDRSCLVQYHTPYCRIF